MASDFAPRPLPPLLAGAILIGAAFACYVNSLATPFHFDDIQAIAENTSIRHFFSRDIFFPPPATTVAGRPLVNVTLALNHAISGNDAGSYHLLNIAIHAAAALVLFGVVRRTLARMGDTARAGPIAFAAALLWTAHPLQTESVTYVVQRAESLMALFYLLTLYCFIRGSYSGPDETTHTTNRASVGWLVASAASCALGMFTKEVMVTAPLVIALYDRVFCAKRWSALARRRGYYLALLATWLPLTLLVANAGDRGGSAGFGAGASVWGYALGQCRAILLYLRLAWWPEPLVFDYGPYASPAGREIIAAFILLALVIVVAALARRRPALAFAAVSAALLLAPTSSVLPIVTEPIAEHRMYLPLAVLTTLAAIGLYTAAPRIAGRVVVSLVVGLGLLTINRNRAYASERELWAATVAAAPNNPRAHYSLGLALVANGDAADAEMHLRDALVLRPDYVGAHHAYATLLTEQGRPTDAAAHYRAILQRHPSDFTALNNLGLILFQSGQLAEAAEQFTAALRAKPNSAEANNNLACVYFEQGDWARAEQLATEACRLDPNYSAAHYNLGNALVRQNRLQSARMHYETALVLAPNYTDAHVNLASVLESLGERASAIDHYRSALRLKPDQPFARDHLAKLLATAPER